MQPINNSLPHPLPPRLPHFLGYHVDLEATSPERAQTLEFLVNISRLRLSSEVRIGDDPFLNTELLNQLPQHIPYLQKVELLIILTRCARFMKKGYSSEQFQLAKIDISFKEVTPAQLSDITTNQIVNFLHMLQNAPHSYTYTSQALSHAFRERSIDSFDTSITTLELIFCILKLDCPPQLENKILDQLIADRLHRSDQFLPTTYIPLLQKFANNKKAAPLCSSIIKYLPLSQLMSLISEEVKKASVLYPLLPVFFTVLIEKRAHISADISSRNTLPLTDKTLTSFLSSFIDISSSTHLHSLTPQERNLLGEQFEKALFKDAQNKEPGAIIDSLKGLNEFKKPSKETITAFIELLTIEDKNENKPLKANELSVANFVTLVTFCHLNKIEPQALNDLYSCFAAIIKKQNRLTSTLPNQLALIYTKYIGIETADIEFLERCEELLLPILLAKSIPPYLFNAVLSCMLSRNIDKPNIKEILYKEIILSEHTKLYELLAYGSNKGKILVADEIIIELLEKGLICTQPLTDKNLKILHMAVRTERLSLVQYLLTKKHNVNECTTGNVTPMHYAGISLNFEIFQLLKAAGGDPLQIDNQHATAYTNASIKKQSPERKLAVIDFWKKCLGDTHPLIAYYQAPPDHPATKLTFVKDLLALPHPLEIPYLLQDQDIAQEVLNLCSLEKGLQMVKDIQIKYNRTPTFLIHALFIRSLCDTDTAFRYKLMEEPGFDPAFVYHQRNGYTPLHYLMMTSVRQEELEKLLSKGIDPNVQDAAGNRPLQLAALRGNFEAHEILLKWKADPLCRNKFGHTGTKELFSLSTQQVETPETRIAQKWLYTFFSGFPMLLKALVEGKKEFPKNWMVKATGNPVEIAFLMQDASQAKQCYDELGEKLFQEKLLEVHKKYPQSIANNTIKLCEVPLHHAQPQILSEEAK
ncbi:MAG: hypothetical protein JWO53_1378 [Chlamydiia bacterium]|nr:hypothetical protein [Chlamydiia bacterium]